MAEKNGSCSLVDEIHCSNMLEEYSGELEVREWSRIFCLYEELAELFRGIHAL